MTPDFRRILIALLVGCWLLAGTAASAASGHSRPERPAAKPRRRSAGRHLSDRARHRRRVHKTHHQTHGVQRSEAHADQAPSPSSAGSPSPLGPPSPLLSAPPPSQEPGRPSQPPAAPGERLVFDDEFEGSAGSSPDPTRWGFDTGGGGWGNDELESYTARTANAALDGHGDLAVTARQEAYAGDDGIRRDYTSARLQTLNTYHFQYGVVEARVKVPAGQGLVAQFWALGSEAYESDDAWPACGEMDAMEVLGSEPNVVNGTLHAAWPWPATGIGGTAQSATSLSSGFHTYAMEWEPQQIKFLLDGSVYQTVTAAELQPGSPWPFTHPFFLLMDLAVGGQWPGSPDSSTHFPAQMLVDWVRVWQ